MFKIISICILIMVSPSQGYCNNDITLQKTRTVQTIFNDLVAAYGSIKEAPALEIIPLDESHVIAQYIANPWPTIQIDEKLVDICFGLGTDGLNALALILSHELAHYYNDHAWCSDYAYALRNTKLGMTLNDISKTDKIINETEADKEGLWHAAIAGYYPFGIFDKIIDKIYTEYQLPETVKDYPSKAERKEINKERLRKVQQLYPVFEAGKILIDLKKYDEAALCYDYINKYFPSRENYNNAGVARLMAALLLKNKQSLEFIYPIELDPVSRLIYNGTRSDNDEQQAKFGQLLNNAKQNFEKAINLDAEYTNAYINLACVYDLMGNPEGAIGKLNELPLESQKNTKVLGVKAIAYYHAENDKKAAACFEEVAKTDSLNDYNCHLFEMRDNLLDAAHYSENWIVRLPPSMNQFPNSLYTNADIDFLPGNCTDVNQNNEITICSKYENGIIWIQVNTRDRKYTVKIN